MKVYDLFPKIRSLKGTIGKETNPKIRSFPKSAPMEGKETNREKLFSSLTFTGAKRRSHACALPPGTHSLHGKNKQKRLTI